MGGYSFIVLAPGVTGGGTHNVNGVREGPGSLSTTGVVGGKKSSVLALVPPLTLYNSVRLPRPPPRVQLYVRYIYVM